MATLWLDSCACYASGADIISAGFTSSLGYTAGGGRWGSGAATATQSAGLTRVLTVGTEGTVGSVVRFTAINASSSGFLRLLETGTLHLDLRLDGAKRITVTRNGTVLGTSTTALVADVDYVLQFKFKIHDSAGTAELWVNDNKEVDLSGIDTRNAGTAGSINEVSWGGGTGAALQMQISEIYINNTSGGAPNNGVWGSYRIQARRATGAGNYAQWTPLSSTNLSNIDDAQGNDGDTTYNSSSTANQIDTFQFGAVTPTGGTVPAIMHRIVARKDDAGVRTVRPKQRQGGSDYDGTGQNLTTAYAHYTEIVAVNPSTAVAYTVAEMRATTPEFGYELTA